MENNKIIIEVKTTWIEKDNEFERNIIEYTYDNKDTLDNIAYSTKYLTNNIIRKEIQKNISKNTFEITLKTQKNDEINDLESYLLQYIKKQWELF